MSRCRNRTEPEKTRLSKKRMRCSVCSRLRCITNERQCNKSAVNQQPTGVSSLLLLSYWEVLGNNVAPVSGRRIAAVLIYRRASDLRIDETAAITSINHPIICSRSHSADTFCRLLSDVTVQGLGILLGSSRDGLLVRAQQSQLDAFKRAAAQASAPCSRSSAAVPSQSLNRFPAEDKHRPHCRPSVKG